MKISQIFESNEVDAATSQPFYENFGGYKFYQGSKDWGDENHLRPFKLREQSSNTYIIIHNEINVRSIKKFGVPIRNLLFMYGAPRYDYGDPYLIIPRDETYRLFVVPNVHDFTMNYKVEDYIVDEAIMEQLTDIDNIDTKTIRTARTAISDLNFQNNYKTFEDYRQDTMKALKDVIEDEDMRNKLMDNFNKAISQYEKLTKTYVDSCIEIKR